MGNVPIEQMLRETIGFARQGRWAEYRRSLARLREALLDQVACEEEQHVRLRRHLETLGAAAPEHDAEGCLAELEALGMLLAEHPDLRGAAGAPRGAPLLDLRGLQPPEPIMRIFEALERAPGEPLRVILPHEPVPLYNLLTQRGLRYSGAPRPDGGFEVLIES